MLLLLLPERLRWTPSDVERCLREAGFRARVAPGADDADMPDPAMDSPSWDFCEIHPPAVAGDFPKVEVSRSAALPGWAAAPMAECLAAEPAVEYVSIAAWSWEAFPEVMRWVDILALSVAVAHPGTAITDGHASWTAEEFAGVVAGRSYSHAEVLRRHLSTELGYGPDNVADLALPLPVGCRALSVRLPQANAPFGVAICCEEPPSDAVRDACVAAMERWLRETESAFYGLLSLPGGDVARRKAVTPHGILVDPWPWRSPGPRDAGWFQFHRRPNDHWARLEPCAFSEFAALFPEELAGRWALILLYDIEWWNAPGIGDELARYKDPDSVRSYGETGGVVGVWDENEQPLFTVPRAQLDLGEYLRAARDLPAVSLTPWIACVRFEDLLRHRGEIPTFSHFIWLDVAEPPSVEQLVAADLAPAPGWPDEEEWFFAEAHAPQWCETFDSHFCYLNHDDETLAVYLRDPGLAARLPTYALQRAVGYRCPAAARVPPPEDLIRLALERGVCVPWPAEKSGASACRLRIWPGDSAWVQGWRPEPAPEAMADAWSVSFDGDTGRWDLREGE